MKNHLPLITFVLLGLSPGYSQQTMRYTIPEAIYATAYRVEVLKSGEDCAIVSYALAEYNETLTPRDDRDFGAQYFVSGKDCNKHFVVTINGFRGWENEDFMPIPQTTLMLDTFVSINTVTTDEIIADGCTKVFFTSFWLQSDKPLETSNQVYLGTDVFIESADPSSIHGPFELSMIEPELNDMPALLEYIASHDYYKLREMQVNKRLIVEKLRADGALKDITPLDKIEKLKVKRTRNH